MFLLSYHTHIYITSPHSLQPQESELIELFEYPSVDSNSHATPFVTLTLGEALRPGYSVQWNGESAVAFVAKEEYYEIVVEHLKKVRLIDRTISSSY